MAKASALTDTYGYPGPEGPRFWGFLGVIAAVVFVAIASEPLWNR